MEDTPIETRRSRKAALFTLTVGLLIPVLAVLWFTGAFRGDRPPANQGTTATEPPSVSTPLPSEVHSKWVAQDAPAAILAGGTADLAMVFRNTGTVAWVRGTASEVRLGIANDDLTFSEEGYAVDWPLPTRVAVQAESVVEPGATATFRFTVRGAAAGRLIIPLRPVIDGVAWLEDEGAHFEIIVGAVGLVDDALALVRGSLQPG